MARQPNSPWGKDFKSITRNPGAPLKEFKLELDGKTVPLEAYQEEQKRRAFAMRGKK